MTVFDDACTTQGASNGFVKASLVVLREHGFSASKLLGVLASSLQRNDLSQQSLGRLCGMSVRTVSTATKKLEAAGLIEVQRRYEQTSVIKVTATGRKKIDGNRDGRFLMLHRREFQLTESQQLVLSAINWRQQVSEDNTATWSYGQLAKFLGLSRFAVIKAVKALVEVGKLLHDAAKSTFVSLVNYLQAAVAGDGSEVVNNLPPSKNNRVSTTNATSNSKQNYGRKKTIDHKQLLTGVNAAARKLRCRDARNDLSMMKAVAAVQMGLVSEHAYHDSIEAVVQCRPRNPMAYFNQCLASIVERSGTKMKAIRDQILVLFDETQVTK